MDYSEILRNIPGEQGIDVFDNDPTRFCSLKDKRRIIFESYNDDKHDEWEEIILALALKNTAKTTNNHQQFYILRQN